MLSSADSLDAVVGKIFDYTITSLDWARNHLDLRAMEEAVTLLESAQAIEFFGFGASAIVARDAQQKFPLFGAPVRRAKRLASADHGSLDDAPE